MRTIIKVERLGIAGKQIINWLFGYDGVETKRPSPELRGLGAPARERASDHR